MRWVRQHPPAGALLLLAALTLIFMGRALWPGPDMVLGGHDMLGYYYPYYDAVRSALLAGRLPVWEPNLFGGYPFMAQPQTSVFYPPSWINLLVPTTVGVSWYMIFHIWLAGAGMVLFVRFMGARWIPALLAGVGFAFSGLLAGRLWAGHSAVYAVDAWAPWILLGLAWSVRRGTWTAALLASLPVGLSILAGHIPSFLYIGMLWAAFALYLFLTDSARRWLVVRQFAVMAAGGLALSAVALVPFLQFSVSSGRIADADYAFATDYSLPPAHLITLLVPEFFGEPLRVGYWSVPTFEELTYYAGVLAVLGIILALRRPTRLTIFYLLVIVFGLWLALGRYGVLYELAYEFIPPFRLVRAPGRAAFFYLFAALALLAHTLSGWRGVPAAERGDRLRVYWPSSVAVLAIGLTTALAATGAVFMAVHPTDTSGRLWHQIGGYSLALAVVILGGGLIWLYLGLGTRAASATDWCPAPATRRALLGVGLVLLVAADMWFFAFKFVRLEPAVPDPVWTDAKALLGDDVDGRILPWGVPLFSQNGPLQVDLPSVFGYDSLEPAAHIALASSVPDPRSTAYDVLGARYVLAGGPLDDFTTGERPLELIGQQGSAWLYERPRFLPLARLVSAYEVIPDGAAAITRIHDPSFDPQSTVILAEEPGCDVGPGPMGSAEVVVHTPTTWTVRVVSDAPALHVLAENDYPGWEVTVDGQRAPILTAYTSIRAVCVPAGEHLVEWTYRPTVYWIGGLISLAMILLVAVAGVMAWRGRRRGLAGQQPPRQ
jgi:hypothetical protein